MAGEFVRGKRVDYMKGKSDEILSKVVLGLVR